MFTGIVTDIGEVIAADTVAEGLRRLKIACGYERASIVPGASASMWGMVIAMLLARNASATGRGAS